MKMIVLPLAPYDTNTSPRQNWSDITNHDIYVLVRSSNP